MSNAQFEELTRTYFKNTNARYKKKTTVQLSCHFCLKFYLLSHVFFFCNPRLLIFNILTYSIEHSG